LNQFIIGITQSFNQSKWVEESQFEIAGDTHELGSPQKARQFISSFVLLLLLLFNFNPIFLEY